MDLASEQRGILQLPSDEVMALVMVCRQNRRAAATNRARARSTAKRQISSALTESLNSLNLSDLESLLEMFND